MPESADGPGPEAGFVGPMGVALDEAGFLYVADTGNATVRRIDLATREVATLAGTPAARGAEDGTGAVARFDEPLGIAVDCSGTIYVADAAAHVVRALGAATGSVATLAGRPYVPGSEDGIDAAAAFRAPAGLALGADGRLYVADSGNHVVRRLDPATREVITVAGAAGEPGSSDGVGAAARLSGPEGLAAGPGGVLVVVERGSARLRQLDLATLEVTTVGAGCAVERFQGRGRRCPTGPARSWWPTRCTT